MIKAVCNSIVLWFKRFLSQAGFEALGRPKLNLLSYHSSGNCRHKFSMGSRQSMVTSHYPSSICLSVDCSGLQIRKGNLGITSGKFYIIHTGKSICLDPSLEPSLHDSFNPIALRKECKGLMNFGK